jgi:hypothetical protein
MLLGTNKRVCSVADVRDFVGSARMGVTGGPQGAATMLWGCVFQLRWNTGGAVNGLFSGTNISTGVGGFLCDITATGVNVRAVSGGGALTTRQVAIVSAADDMRTFILLGSLAGGNLIGCLNTTQSATTAMVGYTVKPAGQRVCVGNEDSTTSPCTIARVGEAFMLQGYDGTGFTSSVFGNGLAGIASMWMEDLQQGRYLTWPRTAVANSDWNWSARDIVAANGSINPSWTDRYSGTILTRTGTLAAGSFPARF